MMDFDETLAGMCGRVVTGIRLENLVIDGERTLNSVWLAFDGSGIRFRTAAHGWGLTLEDESPQRADMSDYGQMEITNGEGVDGLELGRIETVWTVLSEESSQPVGIRWVVAGAAAVVVYAYDDEFLVGSEASSELGTIRYESVCRS